MALNWEQTFAVLREKSTLAGLVGLGVAVAAIFGVNIDEGQELVLTEAVLAIISIVAIATRPREPSRYGHPETWHDRRTDSIVRDDRSTHSPVSGPVRSEQVRSEPTPESEDVRETSGPDNKGTGT